MARTKGLKPKDRKLATTSKGKLTANQWQNTPQQHLMMQSWLDPKSETFGNAYESAIKANYSEKYANQITAPSISNKWIQEYKRRLILEEEHIRAGIQNIAIDAPNSRSPDDTRLKAYETLAKIQGMLEGKTTQVTLVQPILNGMSMKQVQDLQPIDAEIIEQ